MVTGTNPRSDAMEMDEPCSHTQRAVAPTEMKVGLPSDTQNSGARLERGSDKARSGPSTVVATKIVAGQQITKTTALTISLASAFVSCRVRRGKASRLRKRDGRRHLRSSQFN